jgi:hypothetical protein
MILFNTLTTQATEYEYEIRTVECKEFVFGVGLRKNMCMRMLPVLQP